MSRPVAGFAAELAAARVDQGLTLAQVAERAGVSEATVSHWETGRYEPTSKSFEAWAAALGYRVGLYLAPGPSVPKPLPYGTERLFQELIGALAQLFDEDAEAAPEQEAA